MTITDAQKDALRAQSEVLLAQAESYRAMVEAGINAAGGVPEGQEDELLIVASGAGQKAVDAAGNAVNAVLSWVGQLFDGE